MVPPDVAVDRNISEEIEIPREKCVTIDFPNALGGRNKYQKWLAKFREIARSDPFDRFFENPLADTPGYSSIEHHQLSELELWTLSKDFGWDHRKSNSKLFSNYYVVFRALKFRKTQFILRDHIITELTAILDELLIRSGHTSSIKISGLMTVNDIEHAIIALQHGTLDIDKIRGYLYQ